MIKPSLSTIVSSQLPQFVQEDYHTFIAFLEAYYEWLETKSITDFNTILDIDTTLDSFIQYFKNELALNFPKFNVDERFLLSHIKELYVSKGSISSFKLLFRILYNKDIDFKLPSQQMLRVSDGKWIQANSIFVDVSVGNPEDIIGSFAYIISTDNNNFKKIKVFIDSYQATSDPNVYEFFILNTFTGTFNIGDLLNLEPVFTGVIVATTTGLKVLHGGRNFKVGQTYDVIGSGSGSVIKINSVDENGAVLTAKFIKFGIGYPNTFTTSILAITNQVASIQNYFTITGSSPSYSTTIFDSVDDISDQGAIISYNYAITPGTGVYVDGSYAGTVIQTFYNPSTKPYIEPSDYAKFSITLGPLAKYPGYYKNNDGFLDDSVYIQDSKYYQAFSYAFEIDELFDNYKSIVKNILHPTGTEVFGEYAIVNEFNIDITLDPLTELGTEYNLITEDNNQLITEDSNILIVLA